jgi:hypothetical protein
MYRKFPFRFTFQSNLKFVFVRKNILRAFPLWAKIAIGATLFTAVAAAIVVPVVYFSVTGQ